MSVSSSVSSSPYRFMSWNIGVFDFCVVGISFSAMSKSGGNGKSGAMLFDSDDVSLPFGYMFGFVLHALQIGAVMRFGRPRARINAPRISAGNLSISSFVGCVFSDSFFSSDFSGSDVSVCFIFGIGIVNNGF